MVKMGILFLMNSLPGVRSFDVVSVSITYLCTGLWETNAPMLHLWLAFSPDGDGECVWGEINHLSQSVFLHFCCFGWERLFCRSGLRL